MFGLVEILLVLKTPFRNVSLYCLFELHKKSRFRNDHMRPTSLFIQQFVSALANDPFVSSQSERVCSLRVLLHKSQ